MSDFPNLFPANAGNVAGGNEVTIENGYATVNAVDYPIVSLNLYGKSVQNGTPTPETPVDIVSVGDDGAVEITACGKNLLPSAKAETKTLNGVTVTSYGDGSYHISGTATGNATSVKFTLPHLITTPDIKPLYVSLNNDSASGNASIAIADPEGNQITYLAFSAVNRKAVSEKWSDVTIATISFYVQNGETVDITCKPQLEINSHTDYEPYKGSTATITSGLPLYSVGDVRDELIYNANGTGKIIKRTGVEVVDGNSFLVEHFYTTDDYMIFYVNKPLQCISTNILVSHFPFVTSGAELKGKESAYMYRVANTDTSTVHLSLKKSKLITPDLDGAKAWLTDNPVAVVYQLVTPQEIELSAAEMAELMELQTFEGVTNFYNDEGAKMSVKIATNPLLSEYVNPVIEGITARYEARIAALESAITSNN